MPLRRHSRFLGPSPGLGLGPVARGGGGAAPDPVAHLIADLGGDDAVVGLYLADQLLAPSTLTLDGSNRVSQWDDARGAGHASAGPPLVQATSEHRPTLNVNGLQVDFDGISTDGFEDRLDAANGRIPELVDDMACAIVGSNFEGGTSCVLVRIQQVSDNGQTFGLFKVLTGPQTRVDATGTGPSFGAPPSGIRVCHGRRSYVAGVSDAATGRWGAGSETSAAVTRVDGRTPDLVYFGAGLNFGLPAPLQARMLLLYKGDDYTSAAKYAIVNAFAETHLGATL